MSKAQQHLSPEENAIIEVVRLNKSRPRTEVRKNWQICGIAIQYQWRSKNNLWGRFGGGWNWKLGFQAGGSTLIVDLLVCSLRFARAGSK